MPRSKGYVFVNEDEVKSCAEWYVSADDKRSEVKKLHVADRILDKDEMEVRNVSDAFDRMTRSQRKLVCSTDEAPKIEPKKQIEVPKKRQVRKKRLPTESPSTLEQFKSKRANYMTKKSQVFEEHLSVESPSKSEQFKSKRANYMPKKLQDHKERLPIESPSRSEEFKSKLANYMTKKSQVFEEHLSVESPPRSEEFKSKRANCMTKKSQVCEEHLPVESSPRSEEFKSKRANYTSKKCDEDQRMDSASNSQSVLIEENTTRLDISLPKNSNNSQKMFNQAILNGDFGLFHFVLKATKNVFDLNKADLHGKTFLHLLAESNCDASHNRDNIMENLVKAGAKMSTTESEFSRTPLHLAVAFEHVCYARKLIELGSQINTFDSLDETPLITALKLNNVELTNLLLHAGASFHVFPPRFDLSEVQQKLIAVYQNQLQECVLKTLQNASADIKDFIQFSPMVQTSLPESKQLCFNANIEAGFDMSNISLLLVTALVDNSDQMTTQISGETPVEAAYLNTRKLSYAQKTNYFIYLVLSCGQQNSIKINMKPGYALNSKRVLVAQLLGFRKKS